MPRAAGVIFSQPSRADPVRLLILCMMSVESSVEVQSRERDWRSKGGDEAG